MLRTYFCCGVWLINNHNEISLSVRINKIFRCGVFDLSRCKSLYTKSNFNKNLQALPPTAKWKLLKQGIITNALNPKVALFFLSFLPQFISVNSHYYQTQLFVLGLWFAVQGTMVLILVAWLVAKASNFIKSNQKFWRVQEKITGIILIGLGIKVALSSRK